ncbi:hypothetical protein M8J75_006346 [Diaphorina citri]|nr:hypothetical protein M8J75_006346 [Diaphorina citri]
MSNATNLSRRPSWRRRRLSAMRQARSASEFNTDTLFEARCRAQSIAYCSARSNSFDSTTIGGSPAKVASEENVLKKTKSLTKLLACIGVSKSDQSANGAESRAR